MLVFLLASVALVAIPGPNVLFVLARGLSGGRRAAVVSVLGVETATACFVVAAAFGLTAVLVSSPAAFAVVRYLGVLYLVVLAVRALRSHASAPVAAGRSYRQGFLVGIANPKVALFFLAFLPQFGSSPGRLLALGAVFLAVASTMDLGWALFAGTLGRWLHRHPAFLRRQRFVVAPLYLALAGYAGTTG
ncbi:MAG TPA: LysE family translocator [Mycobacteriales bacterium]|nr:LysE family translocator [Mycobacteriales bacterium]